LAKRPRDPRENRGPAFVRWVNAGYDRQTETSLPMSKIGSSHQRWGPVEHCNWGGHWRATFIRDEENWYGGGYPGPTRRWGRRQKRATTTSLVCREGHKKNFVASDKKLWSGVRREHLANFDPLGTAGTPEKRKIGQTRLKKTCREPKRVGKFAHRNRGKGRVMA